MMTAPEFIAKVKYLPPVPHAALKLVNLLGQPSVNNDELVQVLRGDNVLTAKLLRACNSPFFALAEPVASVDQAVFILGHQQILHIVLTIAFGSAMVVSLPGYAVEANELLRHSLVTAEVCEIIANEFGDLNLEPSVAFTVGLLHDLGKLVLSQTLTADVQTNIRGHIERDHLDRAEAEKAVLGTDHAEIGALLLQTWRLPDEVVEAVANHHHPVLKPRPRLSVVTHVANGIAHLAGSAPGWDGCAVRINNEVVTSLDLTPERIEKLVANAGESFDSVEHLMGMA